MQILSAEVELQSLKVGHGDRVQNAKQPRGTAATTVVRKEGAFLSLGMQTGGARKDHRAHLSCSG